ncbi:MAG TPA: hypothetical protein VGR37_01100, partial [Longimicrobiaceae bacterium]|nr:hypothetical protein [Longimicrobiaceae bacterium]
MAPISHSVLAAAGALQQISESSPGERGRRAAAGALVLRAVQHAVAGEEGSGFVALRAGDEVSALAKGAERAVLRRLLLLLEEEGGVDAARLADPLVGYACELERTRRLPEADAALSLALSAAPDDAEVALHAAR